MVVYRKTIYSAAERFRLPTIYPYRVFAAEGGLVSYGVKVADLLRGAASYIDRILRGEKPNEFAVQQPTRFELVVNAKTAKKLGLTIPTSMVVAAQEVIDLVCCALSAFGRSPMSAFRGQADISV